MNSGSSKQCNGRCGTCQAASGFSQQCDTSDEGLKGWVAAGNKADALDGISGWAMVYRTAIAFLLPAVAALIGAFAAGTSQLQRFCGLFIGLAAGIAVAWAVSRLIDHAKSGSGTETASRTETKDQPQ